MAFPGCAPAYRRRRNGWRRRVWQRGRSSYELFDLLDLAGGGSVAVDLTDRSAAARGVGEADAPPDRRSEHGRVVVDEQFCRLAGDDCSRAAAIENEAR